MKTVVTPGAFDTKGADYEFLVQRVRSHGVNALTVDFGVLGDPPFIPDVTNAEVARAGGVELSTLRQCCAFGFGSPVIFQFEQCRLLGAREGLLLLAAKLQHVAPEIALAVDLDESQPAHGVGLSSAR
jgi:Uncharacterised protein family (UPF0261)